VHTTVTDLIRIAAPAQRVWDTLLDRGQARIWRGADFETDWKQGSTIKISSRIGSKHYRDRGTVILVKRPSILIYDFLPKVSGLPDVAESYSRVTFQLTEVKLGTSLQVGHTVPPSPVRRGNGFEIGPDSGEKHVRFYWRSTLPLLRDLVEGRDTVALKLATAAAADNV
jgi:uncharacterized protein YndB with AHSA1/START domain